MGAALCIRESRVDEMFQIVIILILIILMSLIVNCLIKGPEIRKRKKILWGIGIIYVVGNVYFTLISRRVGLTSRLELMPFRAYSNLFELELDSEQAVGSWASMFLHGILPIESIILNILLYYPLGYLLPILFPKLKPKHIILIGCLCSIATEATQYLLKMGWCETDDVIHNTLGTAIGVWVWMWQSKRLKTVEDQKSGQD